MDSVETLTARLRSHPGDLRAYQQLKALYRQARDYGSLANLIAGFAEVARDPVAASQAYTEVADLLREQLRDTEQAQAFYLEALARDPLNFDASEGLQALLEQLGEFARLGEFLDEQAQSLRERGASAAQVAVLHFRLGELWGKRFGDPGTALAQYQSALDLDPQLLRALYEARQLCLAQNKLRAAAELFEREAAAETDAERKAALYYELGALCRDALHDADGAISALQRASALAPHDRNLGYELATLLMQRAALADTHTARGDYTEAADLLYRLAGTSGGDEAIGYLESALDCAPGHGQALSTLESLLEGGAQAARLPPRWVEYLAVAGGDRAAHARRVKLARAYAAQGQLDDAIFCLTPAAQAGFASAHELLEKVQAQRAPKAPVPATIVEPAYEELDAPPDFEDEAPEIAQPESIQSTRPTDAPGLRRMAAGLVREQRHDEAALAYRELLALDVLDREAFAFLDAHYRRRQGHQERALLLEHSGSHAALPERVRESRLREAASTYEARLKDEAGALRCWRMLDELLPGSDEVRRAQKRLLERAERWDELAQLYEEELAAVSAAEPKLPMLRRLSTLHREKRNDRAAAADALERMLMLRPDDRLTRDLLLDDLLALERYEEALHLLDQKVGEAAAKAQKIALLQQVAVLCRDKLGDHERAYTAFEQLLELAPEEPAHLDALCQLCERANQIDRLLTLLRERAKTERDAKRSAALYRRIAQVLIDYVQDEDGAAQAYLSLLKLEEDAEALRFLQAFATRRDDPEMLVDVLSRLSALEVDRSERCDLLFQRARLLSTRLERPAQAIPVLQAILAQDPQHHSAQEELLRVCEAAGDFATLASTLERLLKHAAEDATRAELAARLADVCEHQLHEAPRAIAALLAFARADTQNVVPHRRLRPLLQAGGRARELLATLSALSNLEPARAARIEATLAAAELAREKLGDPEAAWQRLVPWLAEAEPTLDAALRTLATALKRIDALYDLLEGAGRYGTLVDWLRERAATERSAKVRVALYRKTARLLAGPLQDDAAALSTWDKLLELQEDAEALQFRRTHALRSDDIETVGDCLKRLAALEQDKSEKRDLLYEYGRLLRARLGRPAEAVSVLRGVVEELDPEFEPALDELIEACAASGDDRTLALALTRSLAREQDNDRRVELARRLVHLQQTLGDTEKAIATLHIWSEAAVRDPEPRRRLIALLSGTDRHRELLLQLDALVERTEIEAERTALVTQSAELARSRLNDAEGAWQRLLAFANQGYEAIESALAQLAFQSNRTAELSALYDSAGRHHELVTVLRSQAEQTTDQDARAALYLRCAELLAGPLGDDLAAAEAYREVIERTDNPEALFFLSEHYRRMDDPAELAPILLRLSQTTRDPSQQRDLRFERALLLSDRLDEPEQASVELRAIVGELDPNFAPAIDELIALSEAHDDHRGLALALERQLALCRDRSKRAEIAERLAGIYEDKLGDSPRTIDALLKLHEAKPTSPEPLHRLRVHLQNAQRFVDLLGVLDALSDCEDSSQTKAEAALAAAMVAATKLNDVQGAWQRLCPLLLAGDVPGEAAAVELANASGLNRDLANLYVLRAQQPSANTDPSQDWTAAAKILEERLSEPAEALEASLRALALDMNNRLLLDRIDRLATGTAAWKRLAQVYGRLLEHSQDLQSRVDLLLRHADLLERAGDQATALERVLQACKVTPDRSELLTRAEALATATSSHAELTFVLEALAAGAEDKQTRARQLLRAARVADLGLKDREHALRNMKEALALTEGSTAIAAEIVALARELDKARPELGASDARRSLIRAHMELSETTGPTLGPQFILRAAQLWRDELAADSECFDALKQGATHFPNDLTLYDALEQAALRTKRLDALDAHLARVAHRAQDPQIQHTLLARRGKLLSEHLGRHAKAAEVYLELHALNPDDDSAFSSLLLSYRQAGRYRELLKAYEDGVARTAETQHKLDLLRGMAKLWEVELKNRPSAVEVWQHIKTLAPDDKEALAALARLQSAP